MAVKIRLARRGRKKRAMYDIVIADARAPRDGKFIEKIGTYNPNTNPASILLNEDKAVKWILNGAQPTDTTLAILRYKGVMIKKHLQLGVNKGALTQEAADAKFEEWKAAKDSKIVGKVDGLVASKEAIKKSQLAAEIKKNAERAAAISAKNTPPAEEVAEVVEEVVEEAPAVEEVVAETPAVEEAVAEAPAAESAE